MSDTRLAPLEIIALVSTPQDADIDLLCVPVFQDGDSLDDLPLIDDAVGGEWSRALRAREFSQRACGGFVARVVCGGWRARRACFVGAGPRAEADAERLRRLAATCGQFARQRAAASIALVIRGGLDVGSAATAFADGLSA